MSFLDKLHRNDQARDIRPEAELAKLFGKGKNKKRDQELAEQQDESAAERLATVALTGNSIDSAARAIVGGANPLAPIIGAGQQVLRPEQKQSAPQQTQQTEQETDEEQQGEQPQGEQQNDRGNGAKKLLGKLGRKLVEKAKPKLDVNVGGFDVHLEGKPKLPQGKKPQFGINATVDGQVLGTDVHAEADTDNVLQKQPVVEAKGTVHGELGNNVSVDGEVHTDDLLAKKKHVDGKLGAHFKSDKVNANAEVASPDLLAKDKHVSANADVHVKTANVEVDGSAASPDVLAKDKHVTGKLGAHFKSDKVSADAELADKHLSAKVGGNAKIGKGEVNGELSSPDLLADKVQVDGKAGAAADVFGKHVHVEKEKKDLLGGGEAMSEREKLAKQVLDGGVSPMTPVSDNQVWQQMVVAHEDAQDDGGVARRNPTAAKRAKKGGERLTELALGNAEDKLHDKADEKTGSANDKDAKKADAAHEQDEDENQDSKRLPGKIGAIAKLAKKELHDADTATSGFFSDSKKKLDEKMAKGKLPDVHAGHDLAHDALHDKHAKTDLDGKHGKDVKDPHGELHKPGSPLEIDQSGDGSQVPGDVKGHHELEHHGLLTDEDQGGEIEDAEGNKVPYSPMKNKGAPHPKASKAAHPGGHAKPPAAPQVPENLTSKNQQAINGYIAQAKKDRDTAKSQVQHQVLAKSQAVAVDAKALSAQVKQKNDQRLLQLRQQAETRKAKAAEEAKARQAKEGPVTLESLKQKLEKKKVHRKPSKYNLAYKAWYARNGKKYGKVQDAMRAFAKEYAAKK